MENYSKYKLKAFSLADCNRQHRSTLVTRITLQTANRSFKMEAAPPFGINRAAAPKAEPVTATEAAPAPEQQ